MLAELKGRDAAFLVVGRVDALQSRRNVVQIGLSLLQGNSGLQAREYAQWMSSAETLSESIEQSAFAAAGRKTLRRSGRAGRDADARALNCGWR